MKVEIKDLMPVNARKINSNSRKTHEQTLRFILLKLKKQWFGNRSWGIGAKSKKLLDKVIISKADLIQFSEKENAMIDN